MRQTHDAILSPLSSAEWTHEHDTVRIFTLPDKIREAGQQVSQNTDFSMRHTQYRKPVT
jgi:hypothetical protein